MGIAEELGKDLEGESDAFRRHEYGLRRLASGESFRFAAQIAASID